MEVQSGVQQPEPHPLSSPRSGANQQNELDDRETDASGRPSADNHSKEAQPASQKDDKKDIFETRAFTWEDDLSSVLSALTDATLFNRDTCTQIFPFGQAVSTRKCHLINYNQALSINIFQCLDETWLAVFITS